MSDSYEDEEGYEAARWQIALHRRAGKATLDKKQKKLSEIQGIDIQLFCRESCGGCQAIRHVLCEDGGEIRKTRGGSHDRGQAREGERTEKVRKPEKRY